MKYIATILLIVIVGIQTFSKWFIFFDFEFNRAYIAKNLCVNRDKPGSTCNGKCYLKKKLAADESQKQPEGKESVQKNVQFDFFLHTPLKIDFSLSKSEIHYLPFNSFGKSQEYIFSFFQPPQHS